jgi:hypothetical protein
VHAATARVRLGGRTFRLKALYKTALNDDQAILAHARATAAVLRWLLREFLIVSPYARRNPL